MQQRSEAGEALHLANAVVIAMGGRPIVPDVPGIDGPTVHFALDVLRGAVPPKRVVVVAGTNNRLHAPSLAEYPFRQGP